MSRLIIGDEYEVDISLINPQIITTKNDYYSNIKYKGDLIDNKKHGIGTSYYKSGEIRYEGEWKHDYKHGVGISYYKNGKKKYDGEWKDNIRWNGILYFYFYGYDYEIYYYIRGDFFCLY